MWAGAEIIAADRALSELMAEIPGSIIHDTALEQELNTAVSELLRRAREAGSLRADLILDDIPMLMCGIGSARRKTHSCPDAWRRHMKIILDGIRASAASGPLPT
jgi:hypothetical protein